MRAKSRSMRSSGVTSTTAAAAVVAASSSSATAGISASQLDGDIFTGWLKDTGEKNTYESRKTFHDMVVAGLRPREVSLRKGRIGPCTANALAVALTHSSITVLDLYHNVLRDLGCEVIAHLLRDLPSLLVLNLGGNDIGYAGAAALGQSIKAHKRLQTLVLGTRKKDTFLNYIDGRAAVALLEGCAESKTLKTINLSRNPIGEGGTSRVRAFDALCELVSSSSALTTLELRSTGMTSSTALRLLTAAVNTSGVYTLDFSDNGLPAAVGVAVGSAISSGRSSVASGTIQSVVLDDNPGIGSLGAHAVFTAIATDHYLTTLSMESCGVDDDALLTLCAALASNTSLERLNLRGNRFTETGAVELCRSVSQHPALQRLAIGRNRLGNESVCALASMLEVNDTLTALDVRDGWFGDRAIVALGIALAVNRTLTTLRLGDNHISDDGASAFSAFMKNNKVITACDISGNNVSHKTVRAVEDVVRRNQKMKENEEPDALRQEVVKLHYQMYKLEEAKVELESQRQKKVELEKAAEQFELQFRREETDFKKREKDLSEQCQAQIVQREQYEQQTEKLNAMLLEQTKALSDEIVNAEKKHAEEVKERQLAEEEYRRVKQLLDGLPEEEVRLAQDLRSQLQSSSSAEIANWAAQAREARSQLEEMQRTIQDLEAQVQAKASATGSAAASSKRKSKR